MTGWIAKSIFYRSKRRKKYENRLKKTRPENRTGRKRKKAGAETAARLKSEDSDDQFFFSSFSVTTSFPS